MSTAKTLITSKKFLTLSLGLIMGLAVFFGSTHATHAAKQVLTLTPTSVNQVVKPDSINKGSFQVVNQGQDSFNFRVYSAPYSVKGEEYTPDFTPLPTKPNAASWLQFSPTEATIQPGQSIDIKYTVTVPKDTLPGGYYAVAFAETKEVKAKEGVTLIKRVGEIFYLRVAGPATEKGRLASWRANLLQKPPLTAIARLENSGNVHYESDITITVSDILGRPKYTLKSKKTILPQTIRRVTATWDKAPSIGLFKVSGTASVPGRTEMLPTKYVLVLSQTARLVLIGIAGTMILLIVLRAVPRTIKRRRAKKSAKAPDNNEQS